MNKVVYCTMLVVGMFHNIHGMSLFKDLLGSSLLRENYKLFKVALNQANLNACKVYISNKKILSLHDRDVKKFLEISLVSQGGPVESFNFLLKDGIRFVVGAETIYFLLSHKYWNVLESALKNSKVKNCSVRFNGQNRLIHRAVLADKEAIVRLLIQQGDNYNRRGKRKETPLMKAVLRAARTKNLKIVELFLNQPFIRYNKVNSDGLTVLLLAIELKNKELLELLCRHCPRSTFRKQILNQKDFECLSRKYKSTKKQEAIEIRSFRFVTPVGYALLTWLQGASILLKYGANTRVSSPLSYLSRRRLPVDAHRLLNKAHFFDTSSSWRKKKFKQLALMDWGSEHIKRSIKFYLWRAYYTKNYKALRQAAHYGLTVFAPFSNNC